MSIQQLSSKWDSEASKRFDAETVKREKPLSPIDRLKSLSATNRLIEMEKNLRNESFIFDDMALSGQITLFFAKPNAGKTLLFLYFLIRAIKLGRIKADNLYYINADDSYQGLFTKAKIAEEHGFSMISPAETNISPNAVLDILHDIARTERINDKIIVMDTLKKFADMMNKRSQAELYESLRVLVTKGATVIIAGHANKHLDADGDLVYEGTADTLNDIDCAYAIYRMSDDEDETQVIEFRRKKNRGDNIAKVSYQYTKRSGMSYQEIVNSVKMLDSKDARKAAAIHRREELITKYEAERLFVLELLEENGKMNQIDILDSLKGHAMSGEVTVRSLRAALKALKGIDWDVHRGDKNALFYQKIGTEEKLYRQAS